MGKNDIDENKVNPEESASSSPGFVPKLIAWVLTLKLVRSFLRYSESRGPMLADSITYRTLFSVFAGVLLGFSLAALWLAGNPTAWQALIDAVDNVIPGLVGEDGVIKTSSIQAPAGLSIATAISLIALLGAAIGAIGSLRVAMRTIAGKGRDDVFFLWVILRNVGLAIGIGVGLAASAAVSMGITAGIGILSDFLGIDDGSPLVVVLTQALGILIVFALDAAVIAVAFLTLSGVKPPAGALWSGALLGALGLTVLQQLSGLFVGGATSNPLLATFASLIALLLWFNLSAQVILIATAYIVTGYEESVDRVSTKYGAQTFAQRAVRQAEISVRTATEDLQAAREAEEKERTGK